MSFWNHFEPRRQESQRFFIWDGSTYVGAAWDEVFRDALEMTAGLRKIGVTSGKRVACLLENTALSVRGLLAVWLAGGAVASLPHGARGMASPEHTAQLEALCASLDAVALLGDADVLARIPWQRDAGTPRRSWEQLAGTGAIDPSPPEADDVAFIQYSSGSTDTPKGCELTTAAIDHQMRLIADMICARDSHDVLMSWLPMSHDMGLFGTMLTGWINRFDFYLSTPTRFMLAPRTWFGGAADVNATILTGTSTGLDLAARAHSRRGFDKALSLRLCILGAERVSAPVLERSVEVFGPAGFAAEHLMPAYGLAEATLAVTGAPIGVAPRSIRVDTRQLADGHIVESDGAGDPTTVLVSAGRPCLGVSIEGLTDTSLGEISVRSPALARGYFGDQARTAERFIDGALHTGDLGFMRDGELYPVGRLDDIVKIAGLPVYTNDIERAIEEIDGIRLGCAALVESALTGDGAGLTLLAELVGRHNDLDLIARGARELTMALGHVELDRCVFVPKRTLPKTPSGKLQRHRCRYLAADPDVVPVGVVSFTSTSRRQST